MLTATTLIEALTSWAQAEARVKALILVGSRARSHHLPDRWSDTDFDVFADHHESFLTDLGWLDKLGQRWLTVIWEGEIMTLFEGGVMAGIEIQAADQVEPRRREFKALWDPEGLVTRAEPMQGELPSPQELQACVSNFWLQIVLTARKLGRGHLFMAVTQFGQIRYFALQMLEWHSRAGGATDTWYDGRFMNEWAEPWAVEAMSRLAPAHDAVSLRAALNEATMLFKRLSHETAERLAISEEESTVKVPEIEGVVQSWLTV